MSTAQNQDENKSANAGSDPTGKSPVIETKVVHTVDYRSPAGEEPEQFQEKSVDIVHEIHGGNGKKVHEIGEAPVIEKKVVHTVDYRSSAGAEAEQFQEKPVDIVHEIRAGGNDRSDPPKND
ncbi:hypothetical protein KSP40_PGU010238 [Platanthera guangdongensis]|uniref:Hypervirulence associated protein TUDOR domain-containing protein n=1 Tax=Platanthera guangdongensis TaxID=2320717 RepID=A0ABR2LG45_9ASPA